MSIRFVPGYGFFTERLQPEYTKNITILMTYMMTKLMTKLMTNEN